ncbi:restriction endonuclease subunit S [Vibrio parahaemolyticus]
MKYNKVPLGDLITVLTDYHANGAYQKLKENVELLDDENYALMVRTTNFESNDFSDSLKFISEHAYNFLEKSKVYGGDLIMNKIANAGSIYLMPDLKRPVSLAMNLFLIRVDEQKANPVYVYIFLKVNEAYVKQFANGSVTKTITKDAVRNLEISLPPREVQNEIANQYNSLSKKIAVNSRINKTLEQMAQAIFKSWFVDFDPVKAKINGEQPEGMDEATALLFPEKLVASELGLIPDGWEVKPFSEWVKITKGKNITKKTIVDGDVPVVAGGLKPAYFHNAHNVDGPAITISASGANAGYVNLYFENIWASDCSYISQSTTPLFFLQYVALRYNQKKIFDMQTGAAQPHIYPRDFERLMIVVPNEELCRKLEEVFASFFRTVANNKQQNIVLAALRDTLLPKLLSGEIELGQAQELAEVE